MVQLDRITRRQALTGLTIGAAVMAMPAIGAAPPQSSPPKPLGYLWRGCRRVATILADGDQGVSLSICAATDGTIREIGDARPSRTGVLEVGLLVTYGWTQPEADRFTGWGRWMTGGSRNPDVSGLLADQLVGGWLALELEGVLQKIDLPDATLSSARVCGDGYTLRNAVFSIGGWPDGSRPPCRLTAQLDTIDARLVI